MNTIVSITTLEDFNDLLEESGTLVVCFSAESWCAPCRKLAPHFEKVSETLKDITFVKVDLDEAEPGLSSAVGAL